MRRNANEQVLAVYSNTNFVAQDLRELDPSGFRNLLGPLLVAQCLPCTPLQYALEYLGNVFLTTVLTLVSLTVTSQVLGSFHLNL